jgi:NhaP-type Na+/H+ or K+/H+ antiporter
VSDETKHNAEVIFNSIAYLAEMCIFINLGLSVFGFSGNFHWAFIGFAFVASLIGRAMSIYPISFLFNCSPVERRKGLLSPMSNRRKTVDVVTSKDVEDDMKMAISKMNDSIENNNNRDDFCCC